MQKTITDNLIKNSAVIAISNKISLLQRKIFNFLIAYAYNDLEKSESYHIDIKQLTAIIGFNSKNIAYLKESLKQLMATVVEFNLLGKDKESWSATTLLSSVSFESGRCTYSFSPVLRKKLHQPNIYAKIKLSKMKLFTSKYALCLYEVFIDYHNISQTPLITLEDFRKLMGIKPQQYREFKRLSLKVIKPALAELSTIGGYKVEVKYLRENRSVVALKFYFNATAPTKTSTSHTQMLGDNPLQKRLIEEFGLSFRQAQKTISHYPKPYIEESLDIIKGKITQKVVKNIPAYTITVLKNDYTLSQNTSQRPRLQTLKKHQAKSVKLGNNAKNIASVPCAEKEVEKYFNTLVKKEQKALIQHFEEEKITSDILKTLYKKEGLHSVMFKVMFQRYLCEKNLSKESLSNLLG